MFVEIYTAVGLNSYFIINMDDIPAGSEGLVGRRPDTHCLDVLTQYHNFFHELKLRPQGFNTLAQRLVLH